MNFQLLVIAIASAVATVPMVLFIPRQRKSPLFDRILWAGTWFLGILGAYFANSNLGGNSALAQLQLFDLPIVPTVGGIIVGALSIHMLIWGMDRFAPSEEETGADEKEEQ